MSSKNDFSKFDFTNFFLILWKQLKSWFDIISIDHGPDINFDKYGKILST